MTPRSIEQLVRGGRLRGKLREGCTLMREEGGSRPTVCASSYRAERRRDASPNRCCDDTASCGSTGRRTLNGSTLGCPHPLRRASVAAPPSAQRPPPPPPLPAALLGHQGTPAWPPPAQRMPLATPPPPTPTPLRQQCAALPAGWRQAGPLPLPPPHAQQPRWPRPSPPPTTPRLRAGAPWPRRAPIPLLRAPTQAGLGGG